mmetsp:Transcript_105630/g.297146  ORF Transcript_105630/g.297146 Transcript_105630/m.297146 type:complete len:221 (-) Transcript_105630:2575-3237(-)
MITSWPPSAGSGPRPVYLVLLLLRQEIPAPPDAASSPSMSMPAACRSAASALIVLTWPSAWSARKTAPMRSPSKTDAAPTSASCLFRLVHANSRMILAAIGASPVRSTSWIRPAQSHASRRTRFFNIFSQVSKARFVSPCLRHMSTRALPRCVVIFRLYFWVAFSTKSNARSTRPALPIMVNTATKEPGFGITPTSSISSTSCSESSAPPYFVQPARSVW